jgi:hypothetical protein
VNPKFVPEPLQRVPVDLNALTRDGLIRVRLSRFQVMPRVGDHVTIYEVDEEIEGEARVARVEPQIQLAFLDVAWESLHDTVRLTMVTAAASASSAAMEWQRWQSAVSRPLEEPILYKAAS